MLGTTNSQKLQGVTLVITKITRIIDHNNIEALQFDKLTCSLLSIALTQLQLIHILLSVVK